MPSASCYTSTVSSAARALCGVHRQLRHSALIPNCERRIHWLCVLFCSLALAIPVQVAAQATVDEVLEDLQSESLEGTLAVLGYLALPDQAAGGVYIKSKQSADDFNFASFQVGGGRRLDDDVPIYVEGYFGIARYRPTYVIDDGGADADLGLKWTGVVVTGGVGWDFDINRDWTFRPLGHVSLGRAQSDLSIAGQIVADDLGLDVDLLDVGGIWAGGLGVSGTFAYERELKPGYDLETRLRYTYMQYEPISDDMDLLGRSVASNALLWSRYRFPTGRKAFGLPVRGVTDFSISYLAGDQRKILRTDWIARVGLGLELDLKESSPSFLSAARFLVRYYGSDTLEGFSAGFGISF